MVRGDEVQAKLESVHGWLDHSDLDAVVISGQNAFAWVTAGGDNHVSLGEEAGAASVLVLREDAYLLAPNNELRRLLDEQVAGLPFTPIEWPWHEDGGEGRIVDRLCDPARTVSDLGRLGLPVAPPDLADLRLTLLRTEVDRYRLLGADAAEAVEVACVSAQAGDREIDVAARVTEECLRRGVVPLVVVVAVDDRIAQFRHPLPTAKRFAGTLLVSLTGRRHGLHASLTRMVSLGRPDDGLSARHRAAVSIDARFILESRPTAALGQVFEHGLDQYQREGYGAEWRQHHQGGLTGYATREVVATAGAHHLLRAGQAVAWNPTVGGLRSEDTILLTAIGHEVLTRTATWPQWEVGDVTGKAIERPALLRRG